MGKNDTTVQISINFESGRWPDSQHFPLNIKRESTVESILFPDIKSSQSFLIITGFTSLSYLIDLFGSNNTNLPAKTRILIGFEPNLRGRKNYELLGLNKEIKDYWLKEGLSIMQGGAVINLIEKIKQREVEFRYKNKMHAKIYVGDHHAILGSANFSKNGLRYQDEANIRVAMSDEHQRIQYDAIKQIAENFYEDAADYSSIIELLKQLIRKVSWQEALARAIAEMIEGDWLDEYKNILTHLTQLEKTKLWPTQVKGLAQGVSILQNQSNVLIADPTGAGKTKLCASLVLSLQHWLFEIGKHQKTESLIICPPLVVKKWNNEFRDFRKLSHKQTSMGLLSNATGLNKKNVERELEIANILTIDEAHNYLAPDSNRTNQIKNNSADYKILITATPISKKVEDLLRMIELLDIDNLSDKDFETYKMLCNSPHTGKKEKDIEMLRDFISKFTVRRTKKFLNTQIEKEPNAYLNRLGVPSKFPRQIEKVYHTKETEGDIAIVEQINELASKLKGITYLTDFNLPTYEITKDETLEHYIGRRITSGRALSIYQVRSSLRSSHVALIEHIEGTEAAMDFFKFSGKTQSSGRKIERLNEILNNGKIPKRHARFKNKFFPDWLNDKELYILACKDEIMLYEGICKLAKQLSGEREKGKAISLMTTLKAHKNVLAFDSTVITLYYLKNILINLYPDQEVKVASGSDRENESHKLIERFSLESESEEKLIGLCSDKMSESVDMQGASCVFLLDMPSVLRIVEQRIGRVDRMDSMYESIDIYWPDDSEVYSLNADKKLIETNSFVEQLYGSNFSIPAAIRDKHFSRTDSVEDIIDEFKEFVDKDESWGGIHDGFQCILNLKEGDDPLINEKTYQQLANVSAEVKTRVSFLECSENWCFISLRGTTTRSPKWYFLDENDEIHADYNDICDLLRKNIGNEAKDLEWSELHLDRFVKILKRKERELLPAKKSRALDVALEILERKILKKLYPDLETKLEYEQMVSILKARSEMIIDFERLAEEWIYILQPYLKEKRNLSKRKKNIFNLNDLRKDYKGIIITKSELQKITEVSVITDSIDKRIASCIIGVSTVDLMEVEI